MAAFGAMTRIVRASAIFSVAPRAYRRRSRVERKMTCIELLGQSVMARDFDWQGAVLQIRIAVRNRYTALGIPATEAAGKVGPGKGEVWPSPDLCNKAGFDLLLSQLVFFIPVHGKAYLGKAS